MMTTPRLRVLKALIVLLPSVAGAQDFRLQGEHLWLRVENQPLSAVLQPFAQAGVRVRMDPAIRVRVTAAFTNENVQTALAHLLDPLGYALIWDVVNGPLGSWPRLAEIQVFQPGRKEKIKPLPGITEALEVVQGPDGALWVKDEILVAFQSGSRREEVERALARLGGVLIGGLPELGIYRVRLPPGSDIAAALALLERRPEVKAVEPHYAVAVPAPVPVEEAGARVGSAALRRTEGQVSVAILDTGLSKNPDLAPFVTGRYDAVNPERDLDDRQGHGTQMALIASGLVRPAGAAEATEGVPVIAIRAFDDRGYASSFGLMSSMAYAASKGARVLNMSWGTAANSRFLGEAVAYAQERGILVVAAAGNEPTGRPVYPAACPGVVAVSALDAENRPWSSSNYGDFISLSAPGTARFPVGYRGPPGGYAGTSIASAYVAHSMALYLARHPESTPAQAAEALRRAVAPGASATRDPRWGYGRLDAQALSRLLP